MDALIPCPPSPSELDQYLGQSSSYTGKQFENIDDLAAWIYQHAQSLQNGSDDPVMSFCNNSSQLTSFLPVGRSMESTKFDPTKDDECAITMLDCDENSDKQIFYDPINSDSNFNFGSVEIADFISNIQEQPTFDFDQSPSSPPMKKPRKKKQNRILSNLSHINVREWFVTDEVSGRSRRPLLHEFLRQLLNNTNYSNIAAYIDRSKGIFKFYQKNAAAELWQRVKGRNSESVMTYEKLARAIRYYYSSGIVRPTPGRFTFQFGSTSDFEDAWLATY